MGPQRHLLLEDPVPTPAITVKGGLPVPPETPVSAVSPGMEGVGHRWKEAGKTWRMGHLEDEQGAQGEAGRNDE